MRRAIRWLAAVALVAAVGCEKLPGAATETPAPLANTPASGGSFPQPPTVLLSETVAKVNGVAISRQDVELALQETRGNLEASGGTWESLALQDEPDRYDLPDVVNDLVALELQARDALSRGIDRQPQAQRDLYYRVRSFYAQQWVRWQLERTQPTEEEIAKFYADNKAGFRRPDRLRVRQLVVDAEDKAKAALVKLLEGVEFVGLAQQMSLQPDAAQGPLADKWVLRSVEKAAFAPGDDTVRELVDPALEQAAFAIEKAGGLSHYVKGGDGRYHIFQLVTRETGTEQPLAEVHDWIKAQLQLERIGTLTEELRTKAAIERFPDRLEGVSQ